MNRLAMTGLLAGIVLTMSAGNVHAGVIYREIFPQPTPTEPVDKSFRQAGWQSYYGDSATPSAPGLLGYTLVHSTATGAPDNLPAVNSNPVATGSESIGFFYAGDGGGQSKPLNNVKYFIWTDEYTVDRSTNNVTQISWYQGNETKTDQDRVAIRIGSDWYVSTQIFNQSTDIGSANDFKTKAVQKTFTFSTNASDWQTLNFTSGTSMSLGSVLSSDLPAGNITAFGLYTDYKTKTFRFDTYEIQADSIPEPAALGLLGLGGLLLLRKG